MTPKRRIIPIFIPHLGCPNDCVFCNQKRISGALRPASPEDVKKTLAEGLRRVPEGETVEAAFYGGSFTAIPPDEQEALLGAVLPFLRSGALSSVRLSTRPDCVDAGTLSRLRRYGVGTVELGVQSMCPDVLALSKRGHTPEDAERAARLVKEAGFSLILQMMTGLPGDTPEKSLYTAEKLVSMHPDGVRVYPTVIVEGTELFDMWRAGLYREHTVEAAVSLCARLLDVFEDAGVPVIRLGLNPTDELSGGAAAGGAYHPAFGELVASRRYLEKARAALREEGAGDRVTLLVAPGQVSAVTGQKRCNLEALAREFGIKDLRVREGDTPKGSVRVFLQ
ncbi:MAG: radical SAM protein [Oscillospiraceae bacterium]|nr:radical SAM protein [Oscillospiraceae bacterium]